MKKEKHQEVELDTTQVVEDSMIATEPTEEVLFGTEDVEFAEEPAEEVSSDEIFGDMSNDEDMPEPETADYGNAPQQADPNAADMNRGLVPTEKFMELFKSTVGQLPYSAILKSSTGSIKLSDLYKFVEAKNEAKNMTVGEMNTVINFIAGCPFEIVRPLMEIVENPARQVELWTLSAE